MRKQAQSQLTSQESHSKCGSQIRAQAVWPPGPQSHHGAATQARSMGTGSGGGREAVSAECGFPPSCAGWQPPPLEPVHSLSQTSACLFSDDKGVSRVCRAHSRPLGQQGSSQSACRRLTGALANALGASRSFLILFFLSFISHGESPPFQVRIHCPSSFFKTPCLQIPFFSVVSCWRAEFRELGTTSRLFLLLALPLAGAPL